MTRRPFIISPTAAPTPPARIGSDASGARRPGNTIDVAAIERRLRDDRPVHIEIAGEQTWRDELAADWREFLSEIRRSPYSHLLVAIAAIVGWSLLLILPLLIGGAR
jgi:hypothetical protein